MRFCFRFGRFCSNPRTKHISVPPRHMMKSYIPDFNMILQHHRYKDTTSHTIGIQPPEYNTSAEDIRLSIGYNQMPSGKGKTHHPITTRVQALRRDPPNKSSSSLREVVQNVTPSLSREQ